MPARKSRSVSFATAEEGRQSQRHSARDSATPVDDMDADIDEIEGFMDEIDDDEVTIADSQPTATKMFEHVFIGAPKKSFRRNAYKTIEGEDTVVKVIEEENDDSELQYLVRFGDMRHEKVSSASD